MAVKTESVIISLDSGSQERSITVEWRPDTADAVLLYMEPFDSKTTEKPMVMWLTKQTPCIANIPLTRTNATLKAYGLEEWGDQSKFKVQSSCESEWISHEAASHSLHLKPHRMRRTLLKCIVPSDPFPCTVDKSGSFVEGLPTVGKSNQALLLCQQSSPFQEWVLLRGEHLRSLKSQNLEAVLPSRRQLSLRLLALRPLRHSEFFVLFSASAVMDVHAYLSKKDLQELMNRALDLRKTGQEEKVLLAHFFRNKPQDYFNNIFLNRDYLMETYRKDANGDQDSAINGNLSGLFFSASLDLYDHKPQAYSYFGDVRLLVAAPILFCDNSRLYFADFYCLYKTHCITLVLTKQGSEADQFCQKRLIALEPCKNPFLTREPATSPLGAEVYTTLSRSQYIEVLYTEDVHMTELQAKYGIQNVSWGLCLTQGRGTSSPNGIPKNSECDWCNLPRDD